VRNLLRRGLVSPDEMMEKYEGKSLYEWAKHHQRQDLNELNYFKSMAHAVGFFLFLCSFSERKFSSTLHYPSTPRAGNPSWSSHRFSRLIANNF
jgi:hypothetical protein